MKAALRWFWFLTGWLVVIQWFYWAAMEIAYGLGRGDGAAVTHDWLFIAFVTSGFFMIECVWEQAERMFPSLREWR
jgi:hypothetical protein